MEYVHGVALAELLAEARRRSAAVPLEVASAIGAGLLEGLHAAHEATSEHGEPLGIIHRDVSPHNVLIGRDGVPRVIDFGVARAVGRLQDTRPGAVKGKPAYMPPEQLLCQDVDRRADLYAAGVVLWEMFSGRRLFAADSDGAIIQQVLEGKVDPPSRTRGDLDPRIDGVVLRALSRSPVDRWESGRELAMALEQIIPPASPRVVGSWVDGLAGEILAERATLIAELERAPPPSSPRPVPARSSQPPSPGDTRPEGFAPPSAAPRSRRWIAAALVLGAAGAAVWSIARSDPPPPAPSEARIEARVQPIETHANTRAAVAPAPPAPPAAPAPEVQATVSAPPPAPKAAPKEPPPPVKEAQPKLQQDCAIPYVIGADGIRRLKAECL
jgi:serine/threonine-protein kinase